MLRECFWTGLALALLASALACLTLYAPALQGSAFELITEQSQDNPASTAAAHPPASAIPIPSPSPPPSPPTQRKVDGMPSLKGKNLCQMCDEIAALGTPEFFNNFNFTLAADTSTVRPATIPSLEGKKRRCERDRPFAFRTDNQVLLTIATFGRFDRLRTTILSLLCVRDEFNLIIVDDATPNATLPSAYREMGIDVRQTSDRHGLTFHWNTFWQTFINSTQYTTLIISNNDVLLPDAFVHSLHLAAHITTPHSFYAITALSSSAGAGSSPSSPFQRLPSSPLFQHSSSQRDRARLDEIANTPLYFSALSAKLSANLGSALTANIPGFNGFLFALNRNAAAAESEPGFLFPRNSINVITLRRSTTIMCNVVEKSLNQYE